MRREPTDANLLETARTVLRDAVLPRLPSAARYETLMVANAMAIAGRQLAAGDRPLNEARARLAALYAVPDHSLVDLERRLANDLRSGVFDAQTQRRATVFAHLLATARAAAEESNPKALSGRETGEEQA